MLRYYSISFQIHHSYPSYNLTQYNLRSWKCVVNPDGGAVRQTFTQKKL